MQVFSYLEEVSHIPMSASSLFLTSSRKYVGGMYLWGMANVENYNNRGGILLCKVLCLQLCI